MMDGATSPRDRNSVGLRLVLMVLLPILVGAIIVGVFKGGRDTGIFDGDPPGWATALGGVLALAGLVLEIVVLVWLVRTGRFRANRRSPLWRLSWSRRRSLSRQVQQGTPAPDEDSGLLRATARAMVDQRWSSLILLGFVIMSLGQVLLKFAPFFAVFFAVLAAAAGVAAVVTFRQARRAEEFLRAHPDLTGQ